AVKYDAIHPGYGFLSENAAFARRCAQEGITFIGPRPEVLDLFGDKVRARTLAHQAGIPVLRGSSGATTLSEAKNFLASLGPNASIMIKAVAGGGGRGLPAVKAAQELEGAFKHRQTDAHAGFG